MTLWSFKRHLQQGRIQDFGKGGGGGGSGNCTKMGHFRVHMRDVFSLFMEFGGPPKGGGDPPPGSTPVQMRKALKPIAFGHSSFD